MNELKHIARRKNMDKELYDKVVQIRVDDIRPNRAQPRADFNQNSIIRLADSIRRYGMIQPLTVRESDPDDSYKYELIAGERRLRAARMLGHLTVPCIVMETDEETSAELAIIENLLREDLNIFEEAYGYKKLTENHGLTQEEVARRLSISQSSVANKIRLLKLSYEEQKFILDKGLTERHARAALRIDDPTLRFEIIKRIAQDKMNVSDAEELIGRCVDRDGGKDIIENVQASKTKSDDREMSDTVGAIRRRVDHWVKNGKNAEISITNRSDSTDIYVKLFK